MQIASYAKKEMSSTTKKILGIVAGALAIVLLIGGLVAAWLIWGGWLTVRFENNSAESAI